MISRMCTRSSVVRSRGSEGTSGGLGESSYMLASVARASGSFSDSWFSGCYGFGDSTTSRAYPLRPLLGFVDSVVSPQKRLFILHLCRFSSALFVGVDLWCIYF
ncbi:hypothetical protein L6452_19398 [Arctium lappa]|uniref:Uncharacterized protein n=1 Tax=Arctium lappa TaxID=4217 RepID=A0ACB9B9C6_ARCLA|nr:hypothetical protein L6452_19398 [Arctium lappa]